MRIPPLSRSMTCLGLFLAAALGYPAAADAYRLTAGDRIEISWLGATAPTTVNVDLDGGLRLPNIGDVSVAGLTLDESESAVEEAIARAGLFADPMVTVSVVDYAPVLVSGDVAEPGSYPFIANLTVGTAMGLAGGSRVIGVEKTQLVRARSDVEGEILTLNNSIMSLVVQIARLEAQRDDGETVVVAPSVRAVIPAPDDGFLATILADEQAILANDRARFAEVTALWDQEIANLQQQKQILAERIAVQDEVVAAVAKDLASARDLRAKGLQTEAELSRIEQNDADARSRALELQSTLITVERSIAEATRQATQFRRSKQETALVALREARAKLSDSLLRHSNALLEEALLANGTANALMGSDTFDLVYTLISVRDPSPTPKVVSAETRMWPGDTLVVRVERVAE